MKVLALVVLVIAISGLEAGVVKREVQPDPLQKLTDYFQDIAKNLQDKFNTGEIPAQAQELLSQANAHTTSLTVQIQKFFDDILALGKQQS